MYSVCGKNKRFLSVNLNVFSRKTHTNTHRGSDRNPQSTIAPHTLLPPTGRGTCQSQRMWPHNCWSAYTPLLHVPGVSSVWWFFFIGGLLSRDSVLIFCSLYFIGMIRGNVKVKYSWLAPKALTLTEPPASSYVKQSSGRGATSHPAPAIQHHHHRTAPDGCAQCLLVAVACRNIQVQLGRIFFCLLASATFSKLRNPSGRPLNETHPDETRSNVFFSRGEKFYRWTKMDFKVDEKKIEWVNQIISPPPPSFLLLKIELPNDLVKIGGFFVCALTPCFSVLVFISRFCDTLFFVFFSFRFVKPHLCTSPK